MKCSVVMSTRNQSELLNRTLASIFAQSPPFPFEVIVVDDGSDDGTPEVCGQFPIRYARLENPAYRNPSVARNVGYRLARGEVVIAQSSDVIHAGPTTISNLVSDLRPGEFLIATVHNYDPATQTKKEFARGLTEYTGLGNPRPFFFLGSLWRRDIYAIGGNDEEFVAPGFDDNWFADCLMRGLGLTPKFHTYAVGYHQCHARPRNLRRLVRPSARLYEQKAADAAAGKIKYEASGGPWPWID